MHLQQQQLSCMHAQSIPAAILYPVAARPCARHSRSMRCRAAQEQQQNTQSDWRSNLLKRPAGSVPSSRSSSPLSSMLSSVDEAELQLQQAAQFQQAFQEGNLGFGFSAGGLLFPYYLGVAQQLQELGILQDSTQLAGASAGSLIVACIKAGLPFDTIKSACFELARNCRDNGTRHRLKQVLEGTLRDVLPEDVAEACSGGIHVAITRVTPALQPTLVSSFRDREDLIQALLTSCYIPWYADGGLVRSYRQTPCFDGGITNFLPNLPDSSITTVRVCCLPRQQLAAIRNIAISPDAFVSWPYNVQQMLNWALEPADEDMLQELIHCGRRDALEWAQQTGLAALASSSSGSDSDSETVGSSGSRYSRMNNSSGVWLPSSSVSPTTSSSPLQSADGGDSEQPVGTSLLGLFRTLVAHSSNSSKAKK